MKQAAVFSQWVSKYFTLLVVVVAGFAFVVPSVGLAIVPYTSYLLMLVLFGMGLSLSVADFKRIAKNPLPVILGTIAHYVIMPSLAFLLVKLFRLDGALAVGVILVGSAPSGTSSNVMAFIAGGDVALDVSIGFLSTLLAPVMLPLLVSVLAGSYIDVPAEAMFLNTVKIVLIPVVLGVVLHTFFGHKLDKVNQVTPMVSQLAILAIIVAVFSANHATFTEAATFLVIPVVMLHNLCGYGLGFLFAKVIKLDHPQQKAITFEVGMQDSALAATLALKFFTPQAAVAATIFSIWHNLSGSVLATWWKSRDAKEGDKLTEASAV